MTDETKKLYEFLDQLKNWHEQLESEAKEYEATARLTVKKKRRKNTFRLAAEKYSECYAINEVYREFEYKFDLGFKEVKTHKEESKTMPGVFYDVIRLENARGEVKFQLKLNGWFCCAPNEDFCKTGILNFDEKSNQESVQVVEPIMRTAGFGGDFRKPFRSCTVEKVKDGKVALSCTGAIKCDYDGYLSSSKLGVDETVVGISDNKM
jgi:ribosomal protein L20A (L18A)